MKQHCAFSKQRGQAFLIMVALLAMLGTSIFITFASRPSSQLRDAERTQRVLTTARDALIGYAASSPMRPGQLPCPDLATNVPGVNIPNDGIADDRDTTTGLCPSDIGRLPWKTLGIEDLRDSAGERLWYTASPAFTRDEALCPNNPNNPLAPCPLNSDTRGTLKVYLETKATEKYPEAVAIVFAPGPSIGTQVRSGANQNNPANYLDTTATVSNATLPEFIIAQNSDRLPQSPPPAPFNDQLLVIDTTHLIPIMETRVARTMLKMLTDYKAAFPGKYTGADRHMDNEEDDDVFRGWLPICQAEPKDWEDPDINVPVPAWLARNDWWKIVYFAVAPDLTVHCPGSSAGCGMLTLDSPTNFKEVILITPGAAPVGVTRPSLTIVTNSFASPPPANNACIVLTTLSSSQALAYWQAYLNHSENRDHNDNDYVTPVSPDRNRVFACPGTPGIC